MSAFFIDIEKYLRYIAYISLLLILCTLISLYPVYTGFLCLIFIFVILSLLFPKKFFWIVLLSIAISPQYLLPQELFYFELSSLHKLLILFALIPYIFFYGLRKRTNIIIGVYIITFLFSFTFSTWHPNLSIFQTIKTFVGLTLSWILLNLNWDQKFIEKSILSIILLPSMSVVVGLILHLLNIRLLFHVEYTGATRLQGANIAPHLAMLAFIGFAVAISENLRTKSRFVLAMAMVNLSILILTGTRGAMLATIFLIISYLFFQIRGVLIRNKSALIRIVLFIVITTAIVAIYLPNIEKRMEGTVIESNFNTSGRIDAWKYFIAEGSENIFFGRGLGAGTVANMGDVRGTFRVPHNEYIRMYVDGGIIGTLLLLGGFFVLFREIFRTINSESRLCFLALILGFAIYSLTDNTLSTAQFSVPLVWYLGVLYSRDAEKN